MNWDGNFECGPGMVEQTRVAAGLMVDIETGLLQSPEAFSRSNDWKRLRHCLWIRGTLQAVL